MKSLTCLFALLAILPVTLTFGKKVTCNDKQFRCNSGDECFPLQWRCDSDVDCQDGSDEKNCKYKPCSDKEFRCNSSKCISKSDICDGFNDCAKGEDESPSLCKKEECNSTTHFTCKRGAVRCVPLKKVCDNVDDCSDLSDESILNCNKKPAPINPTCRFDEFRCHEGGCVSKQFVCDGKQDCLDGSDENNQTCKSKAHGCGSDEFKCSSDKKCLSLLKRCDTFKDCADGSDEHNCNSLLKFTTKCPGDNDFHCGIPGKCITQNWRCDGEPDCPNGADERDCTTTTCLPPKLACNRGNKCIHRRQVCNGIKDCDDGSDESFCPKVNKKQECDPKKHFRCTSEQKCILLNDVCNGVNNCRNGEDEAPGGKKDNCKRNPCHEAACTQECQNRYTHAQCSCRKGFVLQSDNATCVDVDECKIWGMCSQRCENTKGNHKCTCELGYELKEKRGKLHCLANGGASLILASQEYIRQLQLETKEERPIVSDLINVAGLDYELNATSPNVFWTQPTPPALMMAKINLTGKPERVLLYSKENSVPEGLAYDWVHKLLYMTDPGLKRIAVISLQNTKMKASVIATGGIDEPRAIAVDPVEGWLYWTDWGRQAKISKIGMNGLYRSVLVNENVVLPNALALDRPRKRLYWSDAKLHSIYTVDLNGGDRRLIYQDPNIYPYSMSVFEDRVYWSDWHLESVLSVDKFNGENFDTIFSSHRISAIRIMHPLLQPAQKNHCPKHHPCSHYCLPSPRVGALRGDTAFSCGCPEDLVLLDDDRTCVLKDQDKTLFPSLPTTPTTYSSTTTITTAATTTNTPSTVRSTASTSTPIVAGLTSPTTMSTTTTTRRTVLPTTTRSTAAEATTRSTSISTTTTTTTTSRPTAPPTTTATPTSTASTTTRAPVVVHYDVVTLMRPERTPRPEEHAGSRVRQTTAPSVVIGPHRVSPTSPQPILSQPPRRVGHVAGIVIGIVLMLTLICGVLMYVAHRVYVRKNTRGMNFDNPVYRKTVIDSEGDTEAQYPINSNGGLILNSHPSRAPIWNGGVVNGAVEA